MKNTIEMKTRLKSKYEALQKQSSLALKKAVDSLELEMDDCNAPSIDDGCWHCRHCVTTRLRYGMI